MPLLPSFNIYTNLASRDGSITAIEDSFLVPTFPDDDGDPTQTEVLQHIDAEGLAVSSLLSFALLVHDQLNGRKWDSDTADAIADGIRELLHWSIAEPE